MCACVSGGILQERARQSVQGKALSGGSPKLMEQISQSVKQHRHNMC